MEKQVKVIYRLSKAGQKTSILAGGDGKTEQAFYTPATNKLIELSEVDSEGNLTLEARTFPIPEYAEQSEQIAGNVNFVKITGVKMGSSRRYFYFDEPQNIEGILEKYQEIEKEMKIMEQDIPSLNEKSEKEFNLNREISLKAKEEENSRKLAEEQSKIAYEREKGQWILAHGSQYLKDCFELDLKVNLEYVVERAAFEFPGYTVDYADKAKWDDILSPSQDALSELKNLRTVGVMDSKIVWLKAPAAVRKSDIDDDYKHDDCEAVVICKFLGKYDLVKTF